MDKRLTFKQGLIDSVPIDLGYFAVSFTFGMTAVSYGLSVWVAVIMSLTAFTGTGQIAGISLIHLGASYVEMILAQVIISIRYSLMSLSLSQKLEKDIPALHRFFIGFGNTDECFGVANSQTSELRKSYLRGLMLAPYLSWALGTLLGGLIGGILPALLVSALGIAFFAMFVAIIISPAKKDKRIFVVLFISAGLSCLLKILPLTKSISDGFVIIICSIFAASIGAIVFPIKEGEV